MAGGKEVTGARGTRPTGHGLRIREHRGIAGVHATSARPRRRPKERAEAAIAMAGDVEVDGARESAPIIHDLTWGRRREKEEREASSPRRKMEAEVARGRRTTQNGGRRRPVKTDDHELAIEGEKQEDKGCRRSVTSRRSSAEGQT